MIIPEHITMDLILSRCKECEYCGGQTHYVGGSEKRPATIDFMVDRVRKKEFVRRVVWQLKHPGALLPTGDTFVITSRCRNHRCVNDALIYRTTRSDAWAEHAKRGIRCGAAAKAKMVASRRKLSKLPDHGVEAIRASDERPKVLAERWGVSESYVYMLKNNQFRRPLSNPFAGLMA